MLRTDLRFCKRKSTDQAKQITELQNMLAEQQKQTLEYANRLDENDKKSDEMSSKISTLLQELNKCKIELHYYRSKSPATPFCNHCGQTTLTKPPGNLLALMKQNINNSREEIINVIGKCSNFESKVQSHESSISQDLTTTPTTPTSTSTIQNATATPISIAINAALLMHTDDNKDALNALHELNTSLLNLSPESMVPNGTADGAGTGSAATTAASSSSGITNLSTPVSRDGILENFEKRWKLARNKMTHAAAGDWRCAPYDKASVIEKPNSVADIVNDLLSTSTLAGAAMSSPIEPTAATSSAGEQTAKKSTTTNINSSSVILTVGTPRFYGKRKLDEHNTVDPSTDAIMDQPNGTVSTSVSLNNPMATTITNKTNNATATNNLANSNLSDNYNKKARRVQNKLKIQTNNMNIKTRNK